MSEREARQLLDHVLHYLGVGRYAAAAELCEAATNALRELDDADRQTRLQAIKRKVEAR